jgi:hypothetical protein
VQSGSPNPIWLLLFLEEWLGQNRQGRPVEEALLTELCVRQR